LLVAAYLVAGVAAALFARFVLAPTGHFDWLFR
jgi:hypothetical protein